MLEEYVSAEPQVEEFFKNGLKHEYSIIEAAACITRVLKCPPLAPSDVYLLISAGALGACYLFEGGYLIDASDSQNLYSAQDYPLRSHLVSPQHLSQALLTESGEIQYYTVNKNALNTMAEAHEKEDSLTNEPIGRRTEIDGFLVPSVPIGAGLLPINIYPKFAEALWLYARAEILGEAKFDKLPVYVETHEAIAILDTDCEEGSEQPRRSGPYLLCPYFDRMTLGSGSDVPDGLHFGGDKLLKVAMFSPERILIQGLDMSVFLSQAQQVPLPKIFRNYTERAAPNPQWLAQPFGASDKQRSMPQVSAKTINVQDKVISILCIALAGELASKGNGIYDYGKIHKNIAKLIDAGVNAAYPSDPDIAEKIKEELPEEKTLKKYISDGLRKLGLV